MRDYLFLPKEFHRKHDVCMFLIGQIEEFITDENYSDLRQKTINLDKNNLLPNEHIFDFLIRIGKKDEHDSIVSNSVIRSLLMDVCYFIQEGLTCSLKQRLTVSFALLRKPFVYNLIVMLRLLYEEDFIDLFNTKSDFDPAAISKEDRDALIEISLTHLTTPVFKLDDINDWIFNKALSDSIINMSDKALHLSTTRNKNNQTGAQNFNFIFSNYDDIYSQWEYIYSRMPALLLYLVQITDVLVLSAIDVDDSLFEARVIKRAAFLSKETK
ncbi:hypothetical protein [Parapedobacter sp. 10938]|uniref:hypothetical protein n=1 Tax=Parapedobacter flavus TaxID=3110225 RepID=UPI002DB769D4|nr:hypothetical protein [Parapedobacter sp. 10938]MEC3881954.1 hypothetical protein [Parapedobacter sp. 10938]